MRYLVLLFLPFTAIFLQSTLFSFYTINGALPDIVLVTVACYAILNGARKGAAYGFLCGLLEDLYLGRFIGINALAKGLTAYIIGSLQGNVFRENILVGVLGVVIATLINSGFLFVLNLLNMELFHFDTIIFHALLYQNIYNVLIAVPVYVWFYHSSRHGILGLTGER